MEFTLPEIVGFVSLFGMLSLIWHRQSKEKETVAAWRATTDQRVDRLEEGKDKLFEKIDEVNKKMDAHILQCATDKGEMKAQMDAVVTSIMRIEGLLAKEAA